jgi:hypothetical protein
VGYDGNVDSYISKVGTECKVVACPNNEYLMVSGYGNKFFKTANNNIGQSCFDKCDQGVEIEYTLNNNTYKACMTVDITNKDALNKCKEYCEKRSKPDTSQSAYKHDVCTLNLVGIDAETKYCVCNPRVENVQKKQFKHKFFNGGYKKPNIKLRF